MVLILTPEGITLIDGLFMEGNDAATDVKSIRLSHKSPTYQNMTFKFDD
jgi:hypothetical protein